MRIQISIVCLAVFAGCADQPVPEDTVDTQPEQEVKQDQISLKNPKMTDQIGRFDPAEGRKVSDGKGSYSNPVTGALEMYGPALQKISKAQIQHAVRLYHAEHGEYPKDYDEFMTRIIKANNIKLPVLPGGLEYQYDEQNHKLVVVEKKAAS